MKDIKTNNAIDKLAAKITTAIAKALKLSNEQSQLVYDILRRGLR